MKYLKYLSNYIFSLAYDAYYFFIGNIKIRIQGINYYRKSKLYPDYLKRGNMAAAVVFLADKYCRDNGIDVGAGEWPIKGARIIEDDKSENAYKINNPDNSLDFVFSSHLLEHLDNWQDALREWYRVLKREGVIFLYLPHPSCEMWQENVNKFHKWNIDFNSLQKFIVDDLKMTIRETSCLPDGYLSFFIVAEK